MSYTWIETHEGLVNYLASMRNNQAILINILKEAGIDHFNDEDPKGTKIPMTEIDPFTFFAYIYKHGGVKRLEILKIISKRSEINTAEPFDTDGIPSSNPQKVWLFPYKYDRNKNEINRLWDFFEKVRTNQVTSTDFDETLKIKGVAIPKLTEAMFNVKPNAFLPINKPVKDYLKNVLEIPNTPKNYKEYEAVLEEVRKKTELNFPEISYKSYEYSSKNKKTTIEESHDDVIVVEDFKAKPKCELNTILYGPPGTGKTYNTILRAAQISTGNFNINYEDAKIEFKSQLEKSKDDPDKQIEFITFHQNYSYEDFIQGLRPDVEDKGGLSFKKEDGVFKRIADKALEHLDLNSTSKLPFETVFKLYFKDLKAGIIPKITVKMKRVNFEITEFSDNRIPFTKNSGGTAHDLRVSRLKEMYINESVGKQKGLVEYYEPLLNEFLELDKKTRANAGKDKKNYVIIIDEINRANISRVFGELITLIEEDKRSHGDIPMKTTLPSGDSFMVPSNLYIIGTMNTADKSIALLDIALRRRFTFVGMYPNSTFVNTTVKDQFELLNKEIVASKGRDFQIGHSYFMGNDFILNETMNNKVIPLLMEYFMNDEETVIKILQSSGFSIKKDSWPLQIQDESENENS